VAVVFAVYGHVIQQRRIAEEAYGDFDKVSMDSGLAVLKPIERVWKDDDGVSFRASMEPVFHSGAAGAKFDQSASIRPLFNGDPLLLIGSHSVVLTALAYAKGDAPDRVVAGFVFDPMPMVGPRALDVDEIVPESSGGACVSRCARNSRRFEGRPNRTRLQTRRMLGSIRARRSLEYREQYRVSPPAAS
jgi:hypothetical protein